MLVLRVQAEFMKFFGKGQADDRILHTKVTNVSLKQAQDMIANKVNERYGGGPEGPAQLKRAFQSFDSGRSGSISIPDFKTAMIQYTQLEFEDNIIAELLGPFENDGEIDYQEFVAKGTGQVRRSVPSVGTGLRCALSLILFHAREQTGGTGFDIGRKKHVRVSEKPSSPPADSAPAPPEEAAPAPGPKGRKIRDILHEIADKVEQKSKNVRLLSPPPPALQLPKAHTSAATIAPNPPAEPCRCCRFGSSFATSTRVRAKRRPLSSCMLSHLLRWLRRQVGKRGLQRVPQGPRTHWHCAYGR